MVPDKTLHSFPPVVCAKSRILILGTMPGSISLTQQEYYAHHRNAFWPIMFQLFDVPFTNHYPDKLSLILENGLALWDVLKSCQRASSLDNDIRFEEPNDFRELLRQYPSIQAIVFNGQPAARFFKKYQREIDLPCYVLPSTSPAHAVSIDEKRSKWRLVKDL